MNILRRLTDWTRVTGELPTALYGVPFNVRGRVLFRPSSELRKQGRPAVRAAALSAFASLAEEVTSEYRPTELHTAQPALAVKLGKWVDAENHPSVSIQAAVSLSLSPIAARRSQEYEDAVRAQQLVQAIDRERLGGLVALLNDPLKARAWWLTQNQGDLANIDWEPLHQQILPHLSNPQSPDASAQKAAKVLGQVLTRLEQDEATRNNFTATARYVLEYMGWSDLAQELPPDNNE